MPEVDDVSVAVFPDSSSQSMDSVRDGLLEMTEIAFLPNWCVKGRAVKHLCENCEHFVIVNRPRGFGQLFEILRRIGKGLAFEEALKQGLGILAKELLKLRAGPYIALLHA